MNNQKRVIKATFLKTSIFENSASQTIVKKYLKLHNGGYDWTTDLANASTLQGNEFDKFYRFANLEFEGNKDVVIEHLNND